MLRFQLCTCCIYETPPWRKVGLELRREKGPRVEDLKVVMQWVACERIESPTENE